MSNANSAPLVVHEWKWLRAVQHAHDRYQLARFFALSFTFSSSLPDRHEFFPSPHDILTLSRALVFPSSSARTLCVATSSARSRRGKQATSGDLHPILHCTSFLMMLCVSSFLTAYMYVMQHFACQGLAVEDGQFYTVWNYSHRLRHSGARVRQVENIPSVLLPNVRIHWALFAF